MGYLTDWRSCPRCRARLENDGKRATCGDCGSVFYAGPAPAVSVVLTDDAGRLLLARRACEPDAGLWDLPGGFLEEDEHPYDAIRRELREETGLEVEPGAFLTCYMDGYRDGEWDSSALSLVWEARIVSVRRPVPGDDVSELRWFERAELPPPEACAFRWVAEFLADFVAAPSPV
jgi:ADP-ribose pyrophosphatase YjhB (NUDIX family)